MDKENFLSYCDRILVQIERQAKYIGYDIDNSSVYKFVISLLTDLEAGDKQYTMDLVMHISIIIGTLQERMRIE